MKGEADMTKGQEETIHCSGARRVWRRTAGGYGYIALVALAAALSFAGAGGVAAQTGAKVEPSAPALNWRDSLTNPAGGDNTFAGLRQDAQLRLLSGYLSGIGEDALTTFSAVKNARVDYQSELAERRGNVGVSAIGAFSQSAQSAIGWQARIFGARGDSKGVNSGLFYNHRADGYQLGVNSFVDYEDHKYGSFFRYSAGGELNYKLASIGANYYLPLTNERGISGGNVALSQRGFDARLRYIVPSFRRFRFAFDYYHFRAEEGKAEQQNGIRYGLEAAPLPGFRLAVLYDGDGAEFGGAIAYTHTIGGHQQQAAKFEPLPGLFAPVWREHAQRIVKSGQ